MRSRIVARSTLILGFFGFSRHSRIKAKVTNALKSFKQMLVFGCVVIFSSSVLANPVLDNIASGNVTVEQAVGSTVVNQSSQKTIINWQSFNIGGSEAVHFQQPTGGVALNRINPAQGASEIYGRLTATGEIILVNPAGV